MSEHPAVVAHLKNIEDTFAEEGQDTPGLAGYELTYCPNHEEVTPYLRQLPREDKYYIYDPEGGDPVPEHAVWKEENFENHWQEVGLLVEFPRSQTKGPGCRMVENYRGSSDGKRGLRISLDQGPQSAYTYYVLPK